MAYERTESSTLLLEQGMCFLLKIKYTVSMIKGILIDYDGTLSKRYVSAYHMYQRLVQEESDYPLHSIEAEEIIQRCLNWDQFGHTDKDYVMTKLQEKYFPNLDIEARRKWWYDTFPLYQLPMDDEKEVLQALHKEYRLGILSNGDSKLQHEKITKMGLEDLFDEVIVSGDYGIQKPKKQIFEIAAKRLGLRAEEIAFIGDTFFTDISGAVNAGMLPVWLCHEKRGYTECPGIYMVEDFREIYSFFLVHKPWQGK